jgi:hypothetical protein
MIKLGKVEILCGALADQAAHESGGGGVFTQALIGELRRNRALLALPLQLEAWRDALPDDLLAARGIYILDGRRETFVTPPPAGRRRRPRRRRQQQMAV